uniref:Uncharacterized protein n=1 Tax=viral metagenome TaxID=1070528 RepID=A0A6C0ASX7_9ZZZZ
MYTASVWFFLCYIPDFFANIINKNANIYNVYEKLIILIATTFALSYSITINNNALIINYAPIFCLDFISLLMKSYYAYKNRNIDVRVLNGKIAFENVLHHDIETPIHNIENHICNKPL